MTVVGPTFLNPNFMTASGSGRSPSCRLRCAPWSFLRLNRTGLSRIPHGSAVGHGVGLCLSPQSGGLHAKQAIAMVERP